MHEFHHRFSILLLLVLSHGLSVFARADDAVSTSGLAVVLIDMQTGFYKRNHISHTPELKKLIETQKSLLNWAVENQVPVLVFEYTGYEFTDPRLLNVLDGHRYQIVQKERDDGFGENMPSKREALKLLKKWKVDTLLFAGVNAGFCVRSTAISAIESGFTVVTSSDLVGDLNAKPPVYPNDTWYFEHQQFEVYQNLNQIIH